MKLTEQELMNNGIRTGYADVVGIIDRRETFTLDGLRDLLAEKILERSLNSYQNFVDNYRTRY